MTTVVFLLNQAPMKALDSKPPYEAYRGQKPTVGFLKTFDYLGFVKDKQASLKKLANQASLKKLDNRRAPMIFINSYEDVEAT
jgi:hypothetical protein